MSVIELWVQQANLSVEQIKILPSLKISSFIFILCALSCIRIKKGYLLIAFLLCEAYVNIVQIPIGYEYRFYFGCAFIYSLLYWVLVIDNAKLKTQLACGIMILFEVGMCLDAIFNSDVETYIYANYEYIILLIHIYIASTLLPMSRIKGNITELFRAFFAISGIGDCLSYFWYNYKNKTTSTSTQCQKRAQINY